MTVLGAKTVRTTCPYCGVGCGVLATRNADGRVSIKGDPDHPANRGRLCSKGSALGETVDLEGRLLSPMMGGQTVSWERATDVIASRFHETLVEHGPDSIAFYGSGQLLTEDYYVLNKLMKGYIGAANIDTNSRLCMASSVVGHKRAFGTDTVPGVYEDLEKADLVVLVGSNLAWCHPVLFQRIEAAKRERPSLKVVNIDPRRTATSDLADYDLRISHGRDVALFNGLLREIGHRDAVDQAYIDASVTGLEAGLAGVDAWDLDAVSAATGLDRRELAQFYLDWIGTEKVVTVFSQGVNQAANGTDKVNAIINCHLATGRIGKPGMGPFSVTGQPNAMGGREVGGLATMLAEHLELANEDHRAALKAFWNAPRMASKPGLKAVDLFKACADGRVKALWILSTNPAVSMPNADDVARAIAACDFVVVSDIMANTDTTALADVLLPALGWGEKSGTVTNSERMISRQRPFLAAPDGPKPDWMAIRDVAWKMGWREAFAYDSPDQIFREHATLSRLPRDFGLDFDITGFKDIAPDDYQSLEPSRWPVTEAGASERLFADGSFHHPDGRARIVPVVEPTMDMSRSRPWTLILNTGRVRDHWHTMTRTGKAQRLSRHMAEPYVELHPRDADRIGVSAADIAELKTDLGTMRCRALVSDRVQPGSAFAPMHWTEQTARGGKVGPLIAEETDPFSGQPALKSSTTTVLRYPAAWFGYVLSRSDIQPNCEYWAKARIQNGWQIELADAETPDDWTAFAKSLFGQDGDVVLFEDRAARRVRIAATDGGHLRGLLFVAPEPVAVARSYLVSEFSKNSAGPHLLAGRACADTPDAGALVCGCLGVGCNTIKNAISSGAASDLETVGVATGAGTNCGSCRPEIRTLLASASVRAAAE